VGGPRLEISVVEFIQGCPSVFLALGRWCGWSPGWFMEMLPPCFALLGCHDFPHGGWCGWGNLPPTLAYKLWLTGEGTEPSNIRYSIPSHCIGHCGSRLTFWGGREGVVLTARVLDGPDSLWRSPLLPRWAYPMSELSWQLCVFMWWTCYVRRRWDGFQYWTTYY
jgi:hypothetical protein